MGELTIVFMAVLKEGSRGTVTVRDPPLPLPKLDMYSMTLCSVQAMEMHPLQENHKKIKFLFPSLSLVQLILYYGSG